MNETVSDLMSILDADIVVEYNEPKPSKVVDEDTESDELEQEEYFDEDVLDEEGEEYAEDEDDVEDSDEEDSDEDFEEEVDEDSDVPEEVELTIDGETVRVTKEELTSGYMRNKDYLSKVQEAEEKIEKLRSEEESLLKAQKVFAFSSEKQLAEFEEAIAKEGGWLNIERTRDPVTVAKFKEMYQNVQNQAKLAETVQAEYKAKQEASYDADMTKVVNHLAKTIPNVSKELFEEMDKYVMDVGFTEEAVRSIRDPIAWSLIHKAMMYDKAQVRKVTEPAKTPKRVKKPVATRKEQPNTGRRSLDKKIDALSKTHGNKERNSQVARDAIADFLRLG